MFTRTDYRSYRLEVKMTKKNEIIVLDEGLDRHWWKMCCWLALVPIGWIPCSKEDDIDI